MNQQLLARVSNAFGISGFEDEIQDVAEDVLRSAGCETRRDRMGNVIGLKRAASAPAGARRPLRVALAAHADEVGMMVKHINPEGYVRFQPVGGLRSGAIMSQEVIIHGREPVRGVIVPNFESETDLPHVEDLLIDLARPVEEVRALIELGDPISFVGELVQLNDKVFKGRNFDDRIGTYCLLEAMNQVGDTQVDVYAVSSVQEELGVRGAWPVAYAIEPDIGIALDGSVVRGAYSQPHQQTTDLGKGTGIYLMDRLTMGNRQLISFLFELGKRHGIPCQREIGGGTDASALQRSRGGALATTIGAPVRYMHSTVQLCHADDIDATVALLKVFLESAHEMTVAE